MTAMDRTVAEANMKRVEKHSERANHDERLAEMRP